MVKNIFTFLHREISSLHQAAYLLGFFALLSQILALFRDRLLAHTFGASHALDIYYAAFRVPDFVFVAIGSIVSISVLVPFLAERIDADFDDAKIFVNHVFSFFFIMVIGVSVVLFIILPYVLGFIFPGFEGESFQSLVLLSRILLLSPILLGISNLFGSITQIHRRFFIYALSPVVYNVGIIVGILVFAPIWGIVGVVYGVVLGAFLHGLIQIPFVIHARLFPCVTIRFDWTLMRRICALSLPRTITLGSTHIMIIVLLGIASVLDEGSIAIFNFSYNLQNVPLAIVGVSYSLAAFPTLSHLFVGNRHKEFVGYIMTATRHILFWTIPITCMFIVLRAQIVRTILGSGEFDWDATRLTAAALALFCISLLFQSISLLLIRGYYSAGVTKKPLIVSVISSVSAIVLAFVFLQAFDTYPLFQFFIESLLRVRGIEGTKILMLVFAFSLGQIIHATGLIVWFQKDFGSFYFSVGHTLFQSLSAGIIGSGITWIFLNVFDSYLPLDTLWGIFLQGLCSGLIGAMVGMYVFYLLDSSELKEMMKVLRRKLWKRATIIGPDPEV